MPVGPPPGSPNSRRTDRDAGGVGLPVEAGGQDIGDIARQFGIDAAALRCLVGEAAGGQRGRTKREAREPPVAWQLPGAFALTGVSAAGLHR